MTTTTDEVNVKITGTAAGLQDAMQRAASSVQQGASDINASLSDTRDTIVEIGSSLSTAFEVTGIAAAAAAIEKLNSKFVELGERAIEIQSMSIVLHVTTDQVQGLGEAAEESGTRSEMFFHALEHLTQLLDDARGGSAQAIDKLAAMGITLDQIHDSAFGTTQMVAALSQRLNDASTAADTMTAITKELGARMAITAVAIKDAGASVGGIAAKMQEVNGMSADQVQKLKDMGVWWKQLGTDIENTSGKLLVWIDDTMTASGAAMASGYGHPISGLDSKSAAAGSGGPSGTNVAGTDHSNDDRKAAQERMKDIEMELAATRQGSAERLALLQEYYEKAKEVYGSDSVDLVRTAYTQMIEAQRDYNDKQAQLSKEASQKDLAEATKEANAHYALGQQRIAQNQKILEEDGKYLEEQGRLADEESNHIKELGLARVAANQQILDAEYQAGLISLQDKIAAEQAFEEERYQIDLTALQARKANHASEPVEYKKMLDAIEQLEVDHQNKMKQIDLSLWTDVQKRSNDAFANIGNAMQPALAKMLNFTSTTKEAFRSMAAAIGDSMASMAAKNIATMVEQAAVKRTLDMKQISGDAAKAASGAYSAIVGIPYVGPVLAPAAAAVAFAGVMAFQSLASAEGGYDIPSGINPITQLHEKEMVLPAKHADVIRNAADQKDMGQRNPVTLNTRKVAPNQVQVKESDLVRTLQRLGGMGYRPT